MTEQQIEDLREFVNCDLLGELRTGCELKVCFGVRKPGKDDYTDMRIEELMLYLQQQYGLSQKQADEVANSLYNSAEEQADLAADAFAEALQQAVEGESLSLWKSRPRSESHSRILHGYHELFAGKDRSVYDRRAV